MRSNANYFFLTLNDNLSLAFLVGFGDFEVEGRVETSLEFNFKKLKKKLKIKNFYLPRRIMS